jgi:hypothetical protein
MYVADLDQLRDPPIVHASQTGERSEETAISVRDKGPFAGLYDSSTVGYDVSAAADDAP